MLINRRIISRPNVMVEASDDDVPLLRTGNDTVLHDNSPNTTAVQDTGTIAYEEDDELLITYDNEDNISQHTPVELLVNTQEDDDVRLLDTGIVENEADVQRVCMMFIK